MIFPHHYLRHYPDYFERKALSISPQLAGLSNKLLIDTNCDIEIEIMRDLQHGDRFCSGGMYKYDYSQSYN